jgi:hypothetical protein
VQYELMTYRVRGGRIGASALVNLAEQAPTERMIQAIKNLPMAGITGAPMAKRIVASAASRSASETQPSDTA